MLDNFDCFGDKLLDDSVFAAFLSVVGKLRRWAKPEGKVSAIGSLALLGSSAVNTVYSPVCCGTRTSCLASLSTTI